MSGKSWDLLITNALMFDGTGATPKPQDIAIAAGKIAAIGVNLPTSEAASVVDAQGLWLMPGLLDIHTHLDLEVELDPTLSEVVRHGTTTVLIGNCSLGTAFGTQSKNDQEPIVDCFTRVENMPKSVLRAASNNIHWDNTKDYADHFDGLSLGANIAAFIPHSMLRVEVMGLQASLQREPNEQELQQMETLLDQAMQQGYLGLSTDGLPFHYMANEPNTDKRIPTQFANFKELKRLTAVLRKYDRVWQTTPILDNRLKAIGYFFLTSGRLFGKRLKTSALSAVEFVLAPKVINVFLRLANLLNSRLLDGRIHFQALGTNFRIWSDGIVSPIFEELDSTCRLIAKEYDDVEGRKALLNDPAFIKDFRRDWFHGRKGWNLAHLKTRLGFPDNMVIRDLKRLIFDGAPVHEWEGESLHQVMQRLQLFQRGQSQHCRSDIEAQEFQRFSQVNDEADFMLELMRHYDKGFRYWADVANTRPSKVLELLLSRNTLPGFNDSGAHLTNLSFFDANLASLQLAQQQGVEVVAKMVKRLTREPAEFFGLDVGTLEPGAQADLILIDPAQLQQWDSNSSRTTIHREIFNHDQMVNRSDGVVRQVFVAGQQVWDGESAVAVDPEKARGRFLRAR